MKEYTEEEIKGFVLRDLIRDGYSKCEAIENLKENNPSLHLLNNLNHQDLEKVFKKLLIF
jgi:hypothetical protein